MTVLIRKTRMIKCYDSYGDYGDKKRRDYRIIGLMIFFGLFGFLMTLRLVKLQIVDNEYYLKLASGQHEIFRQLFPIRGSIYLNDKQGTLVGEQNGYFPVATNKNMHLLYAVPKEIDDPEAVYETLHEVFGYKDLAVLEGEVKRLEEKVGAGNRQVVLTKEENQYWDDLEKDVQILEGWKEKLNKKDDPYEPLKRLVSDEQMEQIKSFGYSGLYSTKEISRYYPEKNIGSQLIGFVGKQAESNMLKGYYGLESCFDKVLGGEAGFLRSESDGFGRWIATAGKDFRQAEDGQDIFLTMDKAVQYYVCSELRKAVKEYEAESGSIIIMEPATGAILAMCNYPDFDPNEYNKVENIEVFNNRSLTDNYEPGSVFKAITMAAALDLGKVTPFSGYQDPGQIKIAEYTIKNSDLQAHGWQTMTQVLEKSLNTGSVFAARQVGMEEFERYVKEFGFGSPTKIDLCQEGSGDISSLQKKHDLYLATASFGQGITVTPLQLVRAFSAIANEGKMVEPYVVKMVKSRQGEIISETKTKITGQAISPQTAKLLGGMLVSVVKNGHSKKASVPGYLVAGKTGTAQVPDYEKGGYSDKTIHTFIGFLPFNQPRFTMLVKLDKPATARFAESTAAITFGKISKFLLDYYEIAPEVK